MLSGNGFLSIMRADQVPVPLTLYTLSGLGRILEMRWSPDSV